MSDVQLSLTGSQIDDALVKANAPLQELTVGSPPTGADAEKLVTGEAIYNLATNLTTSNFTDDTIVTSEDTISANKNDTTIPTTLAVHNHIRGFVSSDQTFPENVGDTITLAHGLGEAPGYIACFYKVVGGTFFPIGAFYDGRNTAQIYADDTNIYYIRTLTNILGSQQNPFLELPGAPNSGAEIDEADFRIVLKASI